MKRKKVVWASSFFSRMSLFYAPIEFLFYQSRGLSIFEVGILFAISSIVTLVAEIPFGVFADKKSKKLSTVIGYVFAIIGTIGLLVSSTFLHFALCAIFLSIGDAGRSGAVEILLMGELDEENEYYHISNYSGIWANIIGGLVIGSLYAIWDILPFVFSIIFLLISLGMILRIKEKAPVQTTEPIPVATPPTKKKWFLYFKQNRYILTLLFLSYLLVPQLSVYFPVYLEFIKLDETLFGVVTVAASFLTLFGTRLYQKYFTKVDSFALILFSYFILFAATLLMSQTNNPFIGLASYSCTRIIYGWFWMTFSIHINNNSTADDKATIFSVREFIVNAAFFVSDPIMSFLITSADIQYNYFITAMLLLLIIALIIGVKLYKRVQKMPSTN